MKKNKKRNEILKTEVTVPDINIENIESIDNLEDNLEIEEIQEYFDEDGEEDDYYEGETAQAECEEEPDYLDEEDAENTYIEDDYEEEVFDDHEESEEYLDDEDDIEEDEEAEDEEAEAEEEIAYESEEEFEEYKGNKKDKLIGKHPSVRPKRGFAYRIKHLEALDYVVASVGVLILAGAIVLGTLYANMRAAAAQVASFAEIGTEMEGIAIVGESGLLAMADAQNRKAAQAEAEAAEEAAAVKEYEEKEMYAEGSIEVEMHLSSMQKDLKIKFINKETGKLIPSVPFEVTVVDANKKSYVLKDEDMDGIIYQPNTAPGTCKVAMVAVDHAEEYAISTEAVPVTIKDTIEYKKVDVADEIKKESEVNAAVEDTRRVSTAESTLTDTVGFVESKKIITEETSNAIVNGEYGEVSKDNIAEPVENINDTFTENDNQETGGGNQEGGEEPEQPAISLNRTELKLSAGKTVQLAANVRGLEDTSIAWTSDNSEVAAVAMDGSVTGIGEGTATITAICNADNSLTAACTVIVNAGPSADHVMKLTDKDGNALYVIDAEGNFREAVYADYYTADKFYHKTEVTGEVPTEGVPTENIPTEEEYKYTGWQTIDGKTYYFDAEGNKVTGEQVIQGARYTFDGDGVLSTTSGNMGIDVSRWNGSIDWNAVKNSGVSYVIIRCGYRGSTTGALIEDSTFRTNIQGASSAGLKVGIYFVTQAVNEVEAVEEASMVASLIGGYHISYPVFLDVEPSGGRADGIDKATRTAVCRAFCQTIQNSGYTAGIYANSTWLNEKIDTPGLTNYKIWLAQYMPQPSYAATKYDMWQYSAKGTVAGIKGETDLNISYLGY